LRFAKRQARPRREGQAMIPGGILSLVVFAAASLLVVVVYSALTQKKGAAPDGGGWTGLGRRLAAHLPTLGLPLLPRREAERNRLNARLLQAGFYQPQALLVLLGAKFVLLFLGAGLGLFAFLLPVSSVWSLSGVALGCVT